MAANNDILEIFEMVGTVAIDVAKSVKELTDLEKLGQETANSLQADFERAFRSISRLTASPDIDINSESALSEIQEFRQTFEKMLKDLEANGKVDFNTDPAVKDLQALRLQAESLERMFEGSEGDVNINVNEARAKLSEMMGRATALRTTLSGQDYQVNVKGNEAIQTLQQIAEYARRADAALTRLRDRFTDLNMDAVINETVNRVIKTTYETAGDPGVVGSETTPSGQPQSNAPPGSTEVNVRNNNVEAAILGATSAAVYGLGAVGASGYAASRHLRDYGYDLERQARRMEAYQRRMLEYVFSLTPENVLQRSQRRIKFADLGFERFNDSKNMLQLQATFSIIESGVRGARKQLSQLGFGRTKTEVKQLENELHVMGNVRLDRLKDEIRLTEKALKDMKKSANADELVDEIRKTEAALANYKTQLKDANPFDQMAKANGYGAAKAFGKDVFYKPFSNELDRMGGRIIAFANKDLAYLQNKTYEAVENAATKIVGPQSTKAETKMKINQLAMRYQMFGMMLNQFVTPAVLGLSAAFGMVAVNAQKGWGKFEAQTLQANEEMKEFKNLIADTSADTGSSIEETGELFSVLFNQMGRTKDNIQEAAEIGLNFAKVWGVDAVEAVASVDMISRELGITQKEAADILALALKDHQGDIKSATEDVYENHEAWKGQTKTMVDGMTAYEKMVEGIENNGISASGTALRKMGNSLLELWKALEPSVIKLANAVSRAADAMTEFLRENPRLASMIAHFGAFAAVALVLLGVLMPLAGLLIMHRGLFQGLAQAIGLAGKGAVVMSPQVRMLVDSMTMLRNGIIGLPGLLSSLFPATLAFLRGLPGMVAGFIVQFIRLNPILSAIAAISWVISKNWERFEPILESIWDSMKRIGNAVIQAFAGPGQTGAEGFNVMMDKLAKILGDVLIPLFEILAKVLEVVAVLMEGGGGNVVAYGIAGMFLLSVIGKLIPSLGLFGSLLGLVTGKASKGGGALKALGSIVFGLGGMFTKAGPLLAKGAKGMFGFLPTLFRGVGGLIARLGLMLVPLLANPFVLAGVAIAAALVGVGVLIYKHWDDIRSGTARKVRQITGWLKDHWSTIASIFGGPIVAAGVAIFKNFDVIKAGAVKGAKMVIAAVKRSWSGFAKEVGGTLRYQFGDLTKVFTAAGDVLKKIFIGIFVGFPQLIGRFLRQTFRVASSIMSSLGRMFTNRLNLIRRVFGMSFSIIGRVIRGALNLWARLVSSGMSLIRRVFTAALGFLRRAVSSTFSFIGRTIRAALALWGRIITAGFALIRRIFSTSVAFLRRVVSAGFAFIVRVIRSSMQAAGRVVSQVLGGIRRVFASVLNFIRTTVASSFRFVYNSIRNALNNAYRFIRNIFSQIGQFFGSVKDKAFGWGSDILAGLVKGIRAGAEKAIEAIVWVGNSIEKAFRKVMGIFSPSRVFEGLGFHLPEGAAEGVTRGTPLVTDAVTDMGLAASGSFDAAAIVSLDTEVDGDPLDMIKKSLGGAAAKAKAKFKNVINPNQTTQFNQENRAQMTKVEKVEVHVAKLATDQDFNELSKKVQKHITDETNKEVRRRG